MNHVTSEPRKLQRYVVETTEEKENLAKGKGPYLAGNYLRSS